MTFFHYIILYIMFYYSITINNIFGQYMQFYMQVLHVIQKKKKYLYDSVHLYKHTFLLFKRKMTN